MTAVQMTLLGWGVMAGVMLIAWLVATAKKDAGIVDVTWAGGVGGLAVLFAFAASGDVGRRVLLGALAGLWSFRLAGYLLLDRVLSDKEDGRYQMLRSGWGDRANLHFLWFFQVQALGSVLFAVPLLPGLFSRQPLGQWYDFVGAAVWLLAVTGETVADRQLARFRSRPENRGKTCRKGLWRYSRHPNYFFEWVHWFAYVFLALGSSYVWVALLGPVVMLLLLFRITGIPYTEKRAVASRGEEYRSYQRTTSAFIPWPPRSES